MIFKLSKSFTEKYKIAVKICLNCTILKLSYFYLKHNHQNKLYYFATYNTELILSIVFAIIIIACSILFAIFLVIFSVSSYKLNEKEHSKLGEFFEGLKVPKKQRLFCAISIIRCSIFSVILIVFVPMSSRVTIGILTAFEVFYAIYIFFMKPFDEVKVNIIEVLNECILFFMLVSLNILHGESNWSITLAYIYMIVILCNSLLIFVVIKVFIIIEICSKIRSCRSRKSAKVKASMFATEQKEVTVNHPATEEEQRDVNTVEVLDRQGHQILITERALNQEIEDEEEKVEYNNEIIFEEELKYQEEKHLGFD